MKFPVTIRKNRNRRKGLQFGVGMMNISRIFHVEHGVNHDITPTAPPRDDLWVLLLA